MDGDEVYIPYISDNEENEEVNDLMNRLPPTARLGDYIQKEVRIRVDQLILPAFSTRSFRIFHFDDLYDEIRRGDFVPGSLRKVSVAMQRAVKGEQLFAKLEFGLGDKDNDLPLYEMEEEGHQRLVELIIIDGLHQTSAMYKFHRLLGKERRILSNESKLYIAVVLGERIDALQMSKEEMRGERRAPATFDDLLYSSVSSIRFHVERLKTRKLSLNSRAVFKSFMFSGPFRTKRSSPNGDLPVLH